jgi:SAM-dependent methyltransferase
MEHMKGAGHSHMMGMLKRKAKDDVYDFGWGFAWRWGFLLGWILFLAMGIGILIINSSLYIVSAVMFLIALQLFLGDLALRYISRMNSELVLPYVDLLKSDKDVILDAGCGSGRTSIAVSKIMRGGRIVAVDRFDADYIADGGKKLLERNLKIAKIADRVDLQAQDITALNFANGTFDAAVSSYMLDHLGDDKLKGLSEINRVLKKNGRMLLLVMVPNYLTLMIFSAVSRLKLISVKDWGLLFKESGFKSLESGDINGGHYFLLEKTV